MRSELTILGIKFPAPPQRYKAGHICTPHEAVQLTMALHERLRNNFAKRVEEWKGKHLEVFAQFEGAEYNSSLEELRREFLQYAEGYTLGLGPTENPVEKEAVKIARSMLKEHLNKQGRKVEELSEDELRGRISELAAHEAVQELARKRIAMFSEVAAELASGGDK